MIVPSATHKNEMHRAFSACLKLLVTLLLSGSNPGQLFMTTYMSKAQLNFYFAVVMLTEYWWTYMRADPDGLYEIRRLCEGGKLSIPVDRTFPVAQVKDAHEAKDKRLIPGKVVLELD